MIQRKRYDTEHWIRSQDEISGLDAYLEQQGKVYSQVKNHFVAELLGRLEDKTVLDYGCGGGYFVVHAAKAGAKVVLGVDAEDSVLAVARRFAEREGVVGSCQFIHSERFPKFPVNKGFDVIIMKDVLEHVINDDRLLEEAASVLNPSGIIVASTQNSLSLNFLLEGGYKRYIKGDTDWLGWDDTHVRFYSPFSLGRKLNRAGLRAESWRSVYIVPHKIPTMAGSKKQFLRVNALGWADKYLGAIFPFNYLGWNIIVRARSSPLASKMSPILSPGPEIAPGPAV